jgi:hypothetical protein
MDGVVLPGAGGMINASNSQSDPSLKKENQEKRKWGAGINKDGFMTIGKTDHNELRLASHKERRESKVNLINRDMNEYADGAQAMSEIVGRKNLRSAQFRELKNKEYKFSEEEDQNAEYLAMGSYKEGCSCGTCASCRNKKREDAEYREWSTKKRKELSKGEVKGEFAGPDQSFPISSPEDVGAAWSSAARGKQDARTTYKNIIRIAKKNGWESGLPESVRKRLEAGESGLPG